MGWVWEVVRWPGVGCVHVVGFLIFRSWGVGCGGPVAGVPVGVLVRVCVLFENCIVDASIFCSFCFGFFGDKLLRAIGGCLGIKSR